MGAREKLNWSYFNGSLCLAAVVGWAAGSWTVFVLTLVALLACNLYAKEIRPRKRPKCLKLDKNKNSDHRERRRI